MVRLGHCGIAFEFFGEAIVLVCLRKPYPKKERNQKEQPHNWHVVRRRTDRPKLSPIHKTSGFGFSVFSSGLNPEPQTLNSEPLSDSFLYRPCASRFHFRLELNRRRSGYSTVFSHSPEVHGHQHAGDHRNCNAVPDVASEQRICIDDRAAQQSKPNVVVRRHAELSPERTFVSESRSRGSHVRPHRHRPESEQTERRCKETCRAEPRKD